MNILTRLVDAKYEFSVLNKFEFSMNVEIMRQINKENVYEIENIWASRPSGHESELRKFSRTNTIVLHYLTVIRSQIKIHYPTHPIKTLPLSMSFSLGSSTIKQTILLLNLLN